MAGVAAGLLSLRRPGIVPAAALGAIAGWALPLWILALRGLPAGATARAIAALAPRRSSAAAGDRGREPDEVGGAIPGPAVDR